MPVITVNNISMYYEIHGKGDPLVFIGGLANDLTDYTERTNIIETLSKHFKVIMIDNRGAGRSDKPNHPYSIELMADDTKQLMDTLHLKHANILGISMGGRIGLDLAIRYPEYSNKLILVSTAARMIWTFRRFLLLGAFSKIPVVRGNYPQPAYSFRHQKKASEVYNAVDKLPEIKIQTLILHGKRDGITPFKLAEELHEKIKNSRLIPFEGGHMFMLHRQKEFTKEIINFLS